MQFRELLREQGFSLQANSKSVEDKQHPDRDGQVEHINTLARRFLKAGDPVICVDAKKELVGETPGYKNNGRGWQPQGQPVKVGVHDFPDKETGTPSARPLHFWRSAEGIELSRVVLHDDFRP